MMIDTAAAIGTEVVVNGMNPLSSSLMLLLCKKREV